MSSTLGMVMQLTVHIMVTLRGSKPVENAGSSVLFFLVAKLPEGFQWLT